MNLNLSIAVGRLGKDPEMKYVPSGKAVTKFSVATEYKYGETKTTEWFNVVVWGKLAEVCNQYLVKGQEVIVVGRMQTSSWDKNDGTKGYKTELIANEVKFGRRPDGSGPSIADGEGASQEVEASVEDEIPF